MNFGWSASDIALAIKILYDVGQALSETNGAPKRVKEDTAFIVHLKDTLDKVDKAVDQGLLLEYIREKIEAIRGPLLETKDAMVEYIDLTRVGDRHIKDVIARSYKKIKYCQYFSERITQLRKTIATPLNDLHVDLTLLSLGRLQTAQETVETGFARSQQTHDKGLLRNVKDWLRPVSTVEDTYNTTVAGLLPGTCEWLFVKQKYVDWYSHAPQKYSPLLWISGIPGAGKTNLAAKLIQNLKQDKRTVAYFFCDGTAQRDNVRSIMATLCWQLLNQFPEDVELLLEAYEKGGEPTETEMKDCLGRMCEKRDALILLDGLDECNLHTRRKTCMLLTSLVLLSNVIVLSRELEDIELGLSQVPDPVGLTRLEISELDTEKDIKKLIVEKASELGVSDEETRQKVIQRLQIGCHGMFQWVTNMIAYLMDCDCMFNVDFLSRTEDMPTGLHELYSKILSNIHEGKPKEMVENSIRVLNWVACSRRALFLSEIAMMLRVNSGVQKQGDTIMAKHTVLRRTVSRYCGPLVRFVQRQNREVVILAHASIKDFLLGRAERERKAFVNQKETKIEAEIANICLTYLCFDDIESPPFRITEKNESYATLELRFQDYLKRNPLLSYATANAWNHASVSTTEEVVQTAIERFCSSERVTVRWLQVFLRLCGDCGVWRSSNALDDIRVIEKACKMRDQSPAVSTWLYHLQGPSHLRFSRWHRFVTSGHGNDFLPALHVAAFFDFTEYVRVGLENGANPNERSIDDQAPLHLSARGDSVASGEVLIDHRADVNARGYLGTTPISWAITDEDDGDTKREGPFEMAWFLLEHNADPTLGPRSGREAPAPIAFACRLRQPDNPYVLKLVEEMLNRGASKHINGYPGRKPLLTGAVVAKSPRLVDLLLAKGADPNGGDNLKGKETSNFSHPLIAALRSTPSESIVEKLLRSKADPNVIGCHGRSALHISVCILPTQVATKLTELLLEKGANCNLRSHDGSLPLHEATKSRNLGAMRALIARHERSELDAEDGLGRTSLIIAIENKFNEGIELLLDAGCSTESDLWRVERMQEAPGQTGDIINASYRVVENQAALFPRNKEDQYRVYIMLQGAGRSGLPACLVRKILDKAKYWIKSTVERCEVLQYDEDEAKKQTAYLFTDPIQGAHSYPVREIRIIIRSHDQGWSDYKDLHGTYIASMTFFNVVVQTQNGSLLDIGRGGDGIIHNVHACFETREHFVIFKCIPPKVRRSWLHLIEPGDKIGIVPMALCRKWVNYVESVRIEVFSTFMPERDSGRDVR